MYLASILNVFNIFLSVILVSKNYCFYILASADKLFLLFFVIYTSSSRISIITSYSFFLPLALLLAFVVISTTSFKQFFDFIIPLLLLVSLLIIFEFISSFYSSMLTIFLGLPALLIFFSSIFSSIWLILISSWLGKSDITFLTPRLRLLEIDLLVF